MDNIDVRAHLTATDDASPVIKGLIANINRLKRSFSSLNKQANSFQLANGNLAKSWDNLHQGLRGQQAQTDKLMMQGVRSYNESWRRALSDRIRNEQRLYKAIRSQDHSASAGARRQQRTDTSGGHRAFRSGNQSFGPRGHNYNIVPTGALSLLSGAGIAAGVKSSFNRRVTTDTAETNLRMFGGFSQDEVKTLRKDWADKAGIKFGLATSDVIGAFTEGMKAGIPKKFGQEFADIVLRAGTGLDLDFESTTKLAARTATIASDLQNFDSKFIYGFLNSVAVANRESAADANEIVEANKRGISALTSSKMNAKELSAFTASGISTGIQPGRAGTFIGFLVSELVNATNERGQRGQDLTKAANILGFGGKSALSSRMVADPTSTLQEIMKRMSDMPEMQRTKVADLMAMREWRDELLAMVKVKDLVAKILTETKADGNFLDKASVERLGSLSGKGKSALSAILLMWENVGAGFEDAFTEITESLSDLGRSLKTEDIKRRVTEFMRGIRDGFGLASWKDAFAGLSVGSSGDPAKWLAVGKGISSGLKTVWSAISTGIATVAKLFGIDVADSGAMAKFVTEFIGFAVVLRFMAPIVAVLATLATGMKAIGSALLSVRSVFSGSITNVIVGGIRTMVKGIIPAIALTLGGAIMDALFGAMDRVLDLIAPNRKKLDSERLLNRSIMEKFWDSFLSNDDFRKKYARKSEVDGGSDGDIGGSGYDKMSYIRGSREAGRQFRKAAFEDNGGFAALLQKATFNVSGIQTSSLTNANAAFGGGTSRYIGRVPGLLPGGDNPANLLKSVPGQALPRFGVGSRGIIGGQRGAYTGGQGQTGATHRGSSSWLGGGNDSPDRIGNTAGGFNAKAPWVMNQLMKDFSLTREQAAGIVGNLGHESVGLQAINEKNPVVPGSRGGFGWAQWTGPRWKAFEAWTFKNRLDIKSDAANYGFLKHELMTSEKSTIAALRRQNTIEGSVRSFENTFERAGVKGWGSRYKWANRANQLYNPQATAPGANVPPSAGAIQNVPGPESKNFNQTPLGQRNGSAVININGNAHNPEAMATLVQRRMDESIGWRSHDVESEMA